LPVGSATFFLALALALALAFRWPPAVVVVVVVVVCGWVEGFCFSVGWLGAGLGAVLEDDELDVELDGEVEVELDGKVEVELEVELDGEVEVELEVEDDEDDELEPELLELDPVPLALEDDRLVVLDELELSGTQFSVSEAIMPVTGGSARLEIGVPGATPGTAKL
jgi:hypothetical protein